MVHRCDISIEAEEKNGTTQPYGLIYHNNTKFVHFGKNVVTKYSAKQWILEKQTIYIV